MVLPWRIEVIDSQTRPVERSSQRDGRTGKQIFMNLDGAKVTVVREHLPQKAENFNYRRSGSPEVKAPGCMECAAPGWSDEGDEQLIGRNGEAV